MEKTKKMMKRGKKDVQEPRSFEGAILGLSGERT